MSDRNRNTPPSRAARHRGAFVEPLETRRLMAADPMAGTAVLGDDGVVHVTGTKAADVIVVSLNAADATKLDVTINNAPAGTFDLAVAATPDAAVTAVVTGLRLDGGKGNDTLRVDAAVTLDATLVGAQGHDSLFGGGGNDTLDGAQGKDTLDGGAGNDVLRGAQGNDALSGGPGDDMLFGAQGKDSLLGGDGNDALDGAQGKDLLDGGAGLDQLRGGKGKDTFAAGDDLAEILDAEKGERGGPAKKGRKAK